jgi:cyclopropane fatty-acyl-phospholipid synthase-like methyltransferase
MSTNINNTFFEGSYQQAWRHMMPQGLTLAETDFIWDVAALQPGHKVLDLMCGYGRHTFELAHRGAEVTAVDNLDSYIDEINDKATVAPLPVKALCVDVLDLSLTDTYDAAICMGNSFAFFSREDAIAILKNIAAHLKAGGIFILNSWMVAEVAIRHFKERDWHHAGDFQCILHSKYLLFPSRIETEQTIISPDGTIEKRSGVDYIFTLNELADMALQAGLKLKQVFSTPRKKPFTLGDAVSYLVMEKL